MCSVTLIARRNGYALGMNRDEQCTRVAARPPMRQQCGEHTAFFPTEPGGGTWLGMNDVGVTFALINWYAVTAHAPGKAVSRGEIPRAALATDSPDQALTALRQLPLPRINPFRLIGVFLAPRIVVEWRWNLRQLTRLEHPWCAATWISSGYDEPGAQQTRGKIFRAALCQRSAGTVDWLRRLHRSHRPETGPYCHCMHRADAATVSYTEVLVTPAVATLRYTPGAPCCTASGVATHLPLVH